MAYQKLEADYPEDAYGGLGGACNKFVREGRGTRADFMRIILEIARRG